MPGFGWLSPMHLVLILAVVLIVVGPGKLPETGQALGKAIRGFREGFEGHDGAAAGDPQAAPQNQPQAYAPYQQPAAPYGQQPYAAQQPYQGQPYTPQPYPQSYPAPVTAPQPYPPQQYAPFGAVPQASQPYGQPATQPEANGSAAEGQH